MKKGFVAGRFYRTYVQARSRPGTVAIVGILLLFFFYSVQRTMATSAGYRLAWLRDERRHLQNENHYIRWARIRAVSREALEARAEKKGLRIPLPSEEILVVAKEGD